MSETVIHVGGDVLADTLAGHWRKGAYGNKQAMCLHGAIRRCCPVPGDAYLIEQVEARLGRWSTSWNDDDDRTEAEVVELARRGWDITDADLAETFGPQWRAVVSVVRRAATLAADEAERLGAAGDAAWDAAWGAARGAARDAAWGAARDAAWGAARGAARGAAGGAARGAARGAGGGGGKSARGEILPGENFGGGGEQCGWGGGKNLPGGEGKSVLPNIE